MEHVQQQQYLQPQALRRRAACDRCHAQKLRCLKPSGSEICARCLKARVPCVYSPSLRGYKPPPSALSSSNGHAESLTNGFGTAAASNGFVNDPVAEVGGASLGDTMDWNAPGAFDMSMSDFGMVEGLNGFSLSEQDLSHSSTDDGLREGENGSTMYGEQYAFSKENSVYAVKVTSTENRDGSKDLDEGRAQLGVNGDKSSCDSQDDSGRPPVDPRISVLRDLADLSLNLYEHADSLPDLPTSEELAEALRSEESTPSDKSSLDGSSGASNAEGLSLDSRSRGYNKALDKDFAMDRTFHFSQVLIDLYPRFTANLLYCKPPLAVNLPPDLRFELPSRKSRSPSLMSMSRVSPGPVTESTVRAANSTSRSQSGSPSAPRTAIDHSSILSLLSVHLRLIEVYENLFTHSQFCMHEALLPGRKPQVLTSNIPVLKIGSYTPPSDSVVHMHLLLLEQLLEQLLERVEDLLRNIQRAAQRDEQRFEYLAGVEVEVGDDENDPPDSDGEMRRNGVPEKSVDLTELTCLAVRDRAKGILETVTYFRKQLAKYGWIRATPS